MIIGNVSEATEKSCHDVEEVKRLETWPDLLNTDLPRHSFIFALSDDQGSPRKLIDYMDPFSSNDLKQRF